MPSPASETAKPNLGAHYTSEKNILKLIGPLFLDGLKDELDNARNDDKKLAQLHRKLATLKFLDPACGCGNFPVIAYRELRLLELEVLRRQFATQQSLLAHVQDHVLVDVDQFHGTSSDPVPRRRLEHRLSGFPPRVRLHLIHELREGRTCR